MKYIRRLLVPSAPESELPNVDYEEMMLDEMVEMWLHWLNPEVAHAGTRTGLVFSRPSPQLTSIRTSGEHPAPCTAERTHHSFPYLPWQRTPRATFATAAITSGKRSHVADLHNKMLSGCHDHPLRKNTLSSSASPPASLEANPGFSATPTTDESVSRRSTAQHP
ncbi:hypothetical protein OBBRIDRAFT_835853 [Obba rivulosa]|uniref:Uncharacterized protein n=1 Tax=Obba rivulosa TaxID=1052685 RepID=A0A8E2DNA9_9APHY|nr:hypothetical protein OBBRIDRAFT_835853 [Obba rivulosa]